MSTPSWKSFKVLAVVVALAAGSTVGCVPDYATQDKSAVVLRIIKIITQSGDEDQDSDFLLSDVSPNFNDNAVITMDVVGKTQFGNASNFNAVAVERYEVRYFRSDGRNTEGVDVPFRITGPIATLVPIGGRTEEAAIVLVRHQAKLEPPLLNLVGGGGAELITCIAEITVHGRTLSGDAVKASGRVQITFGDFGGPTE